LLLCIGLPMLMGFVIQISVTKYFFGSATLILILLAKGFSEIRLTLVKGLLIILLITSAAPVHLQLSTQPRHNWDQVGNTLEQMKDREVRQVVITHPFSYILPLSSYYRGEIKPFFPNDEAFSISDEVVKYNWQGVVNHDNVSNIEAYIGDAEEVILVAGATGIEDPVKEWFWKNSWTLKDHITWDGYGDPEVYVFSRE